MPQLDKKKAKSVGEAEGSNYEALPEGPYAGVLKSVTVREGKKGDYWSWEFDIVEPDEFENRKLWVNTSLSDAADWKMKEVFEAFGVPADTDTDDLCGQVILLIVSQREIEQGARRGQVGNNVDQCLPYDGDLESVGAAGGDSAWD